LVKVQRKKVSTSRIGPLGFQKWYCTQNYRILEYNSTVVVSMRPDRCSNSLVVVLVLVAAALACHTPLSITSFKK